MKRDLFVQILREAEKLAKRVLLARQFGGAQLRPTALGGFAKTMRLG